MPNLLSTRLKVLHVITQLELGGAQKNALTILARMSFDQYEIHLISSSGLLEEEAREIPGLRLTLFPFLRRSLNPFLDLIAFFALLGYMRKNKIDIVHTHSSKAGILGRWAARCSGVRVIVHTVHGWGFHDQFKSFFNDFYIFLERMTAKITTYLVAVTENDIRCGLDHAIGRRDQYRLIRYGIDDKASNALPAAIRDLRDSLGIGNEKIVGMVACLKPQKNPLDLVRCAELVLRRYPGVKFLHIGDGVLRRRVEREIKKRKLEDHFLMLGWRRDVSALMPLFDCLVLTSLWEGLPLVILEGMVFSKPIVAYDVCGVAEAVHDGVNGFLVRPKDHEALAQKISLLLEDEKLCVKMGKFSRVMRDSGDFSSETMMRRMESLYRGENA